jgi:hypothetical protein
MSMKNSESEYWFDQTEKLWCLTKEVHFREENPGILILFLRKTVLYSSFLMVKQ